MANEVTLTASLSVSKIPPMVSAEGMNIANALYNLSSGIYSKGTLLVSHTAATVIPLGQVTTPGFAVLYNSDGTNYITIQDGSGGTEFLRLKAGQFDVVNFGPAVVPYAKANTADCNLQYLIFNG